MWLADYRQPPNKRKQLTGASVLKDTWDSADAGKSPQLVRGPFGREMMTVKTILLRSTQILLQAALLPALAWGQQSTLGLTLAQIISSGKGVARDCLEPEYRTALGARLSVPVLSKWTTLQVAGRGYWLDRGSECVDGFPPPDGTYVEEDRVNLLSRSFITTDERLAARLGEIPVNLAVGGGNAWHEGHDLPYLVLAAGISILDRPDVGLGLEGEYQWLRVTSDQFRRTYQDFDLVAEEPLGRVHEWSHAFIIGITLSVPL
jgi:hypothetical protein